MPGLTACLLGLILFAARMPVMTAMGSYLVRAEAPRKAELAVVLAGGANGQRILRAGQLVKDGYAPIVLVSGPDGVYGLHECDLAIPYAVKHGYPESYFAHFEHSVRSTAEEADSIAVELRRRGVKSVLLVTSNYHTRRAANIFRERAPEIEIIPVEAPDENFTANGWWHSREGQKTFLYEWEKTVAEWVGL